MTAVPHIAPALRLPRLTFRISGGTNIAAVALLCAIPAALAVTVLWSLTQGGGVTTLALVYTATGNVTFLLVLAGLAGLQTDSEC